MHGEFGHISEIAEDSSDARIEYGGIVGDWRGTSRGGCPLKNRFGQPECPNQRECEEYGGSVDWSVVIELEKVKITERNGKRKFLFRLLLVSVWILFFGIIAGKEIHGGTLDLETYIALTAGPLLGAAIDRYLREGSKKTRHE